MKLTKDEVLKLAKLSRLRLSENDITKFQTEISDILDYVTKLDDVDVTGLKPTYQVTGLTSEHANATREDQVLDQVIQAELFKNVPMVEDGHIKVKRMIG